MPRKKGDISLTVPEIEKAKALAAMGKSYRQVGAELGRSDHTIKRVLTGSPEIIVEVQTMKKDLATLYDDLPQRMVGSITDEDIKKLNAYQRTVSGAIATDKSRLLKGESTANVNVAVLLDVMEAIRRQDQPDKYSQRRQQEHALPNIAGFIDSYYNRVRLHSALGYRLPEEFERTVELEAASAGASMSFFRHEEIFRSDVCAGLNRSRLSRPSAR